MKKVFSKIFDYGVPVAISVLLVVWLFHKVNVHDMVKVVKEGCNVWFIILMMAITTLSHILRGIRWGIQLRGAGVPRMPVVRESVSIFGAYALNLVIPRLGEVWRCIYISRRENVKISTVVGTDLGDRLSDLVVVIALFILALFVAHGAIVAFLTRYSMGRDLTHIAEDPWFWLLLAAAVGVLWWIFHYMRRIHWVAKVDGSIDRIWNGFRVLFTMKGKTAYVLLTLGIWTCYFMETYTMFFAFPFTRELIHAPGLAAGFVPGLVVFVFGSFSMAIPSNGGLGPWNIAVMFALTLYGVSQAQGAAFAMVMWGSQAAWLVVLGLFSAAYIAWDNKNRAKNPAVPKKPRS